MNLVKTVMIVALLLIASLALAKGPQGVTNGLHNLSTTGVVAGAPPFFIPGQSPYASDEDGVCVFCHTPHGGELTGPLWNRTDPNPASGWKHYNSATLTITDTVARTPNDESLLCLSCHDGSISVYHVINPPNDRNGAEILNANTLADPDLEIVNGFNSSAARIGGSLANTGGTGDLSDDHPISFSYQGVVDAYVGTGREGQLQLLSVAETKGVRFFGPSGENVECSSCHDPHVNYYDNPAYTPFLIMSNSGSAMCLACHNK